jgi:hypothetical protein
VIAVIFLSALLAGATDRPPLHEASPAEIDSLLNDPSWTGRTAGEKLEILADLRAGTPYELGCLGEGRDPDGDPVFRLDRADCTVLVVTNAALLHARSWEDAVRWMERIHYRDGRPSYESRYHFTSDRIDASPFFEDVTALAAPDSALRTIEATLNRREDGERLLPVPWERSITLRYLPSGAYSEETLARLTLPCGVAFVHEKNTRSGFIVSHEGILREGGILHHASSAAGEAADVPLAEYLAVEGGGFRFDGLLFFRFLRPPD